MFKVKGTQLAVEQLDLYVRRKEAMFVDEYRRLVWATLRELVLTTPQWTGHAAANWNIGIDHPDNTVHDWSHQQDLEHKFGMPTEVKRVGDIGAWDAVKSRYGGSAGSAFMKQIKRRTKVYFSNGVYGDNKWGDDETIFYLAEYQNPAWHDKLRVVNRPYETAHEVIRRMGEYWKTRGALGGSFGIGFGRIGGVAADGEFL